MKEYMQVDREVNGPVSALPKKSKVENGLHEVDEATLRKGENRYPKYYHNPTEHTSTNPTALAHYQ